MHRWYQTHTDAGITGNEYYRALLIAGQFSVNKKMQLTAMVPYQVNQLINTNETKTLSGFGDMNVQVNYKLWDKLTKLNRQTIIIGGGIKLPTGIYTAAKTEDIDDQNFQLGTGSIDYMLNASYCLSCRKWVLSAAASYKYNTQNKDDYRYGDVITTGVTAVYRVDLDGFSIAPYAQVIQETQMKDASHQILQYHSGGNVLYTGAGFDVNTKKITVGCNYQYSPSQNLADGQINVKPRITTHISFTL